MVAITQARLCELLHYEPDAGCFTWRVRRGRVRAGSRAGCAAHMGGGLYYLKIGIDGALYNAHRLAWLYMTGEWPSAEIDHRDTNGLNNCWSNLRVATRGQNEANKPTRSDNVSGIKGVRWTQGAWAARIVVDGKRRHLGRFRTAAEAHAAYTAAAREHFGEFARAA